MSVYKVIVYTENKKIVDWIPILFRDDCEMSICGRGKFEIMNTPGVYLINQHPVKDHKDWVKLTMRNSGLGDKKYISYYERLWFYND